MFQSNVLRPTNLQGVGPRDVVCAGNLSLYSLALAPAHVSGVAAVQGMAGLVLDGNNVKYKYASWDVIGVPLQDSLLSRELYRA